MNASLPLGEICLLHFEHMDLIDYLLKQHTLRRRLFLVYYSARKSFDFRYEISVCKRNDLDTNSCDPQFD